MLPKLPIFLTALLCLCTAPFAAAQAPAPDDIERARAVVARNTAAMTPVSGSCSRSIREPNLRPAIGREIQTPIPPTRERRSRKTPAMRG